MGIKTLEVKLGRISLKTPIIIASGIFSYGEINLDYLDYKKLGAITTKTITFNPRKGNPQPRIWETPSGMINCIGLQNPGIKEFINKKLYSINIPGIKTIVSISGESTDEVKRMTELLVKKGVDAIELNLSCPNVNRENIMVSQSPADTYSFVKAVRDIDGNITLIAKLSPNITDITETALAAEKGGADVLNLINTVKAVAVDIKKKRIIEGGLSGSAIKPIGLRAVFDVYKKVKIPIIGTGGITTGQDALEYILMGASAVGIGSGLFSNPYLIDKIYLSFLQFLKENNIKKISNATGLLNEKKYKGAEKRED
ncbi:MAG: dihydroorotate dehydrogenase [Candidatus Omnitrophica bacterium]|nr:dihydroorotate dehydrogenase [Candidatus Omnitrophota bacterium]MCM8776872.1 dihydroorotate dehydrogenase [Candidatus Omnitrophota bacterium]